MTPRIGLVALTLVSLTQAGCAGMMASWRAHNCHYDGAYKAGMNDARNGEEMRMNFSHPCRAETRAEVERGYREGYTAGVGGGQVVVGGGAQGGGVVVSAGGVGAGPVAAQGDPAWRCRTAYGQRRCGFGCVKAYGKIACARERHHNCVQAYGNVACGPNCRSEYGKIVCDW